MAVTDNTKAKLLRGVVQDNVDVVQGVRIKRAAKRRLSFRYWLSGCIASLGIAYLVIPSRVVSTVDTLARPWLLRGGMALHGGIVFFSLIGGLAAFGPIGVLLGPLTVTFLLAVVRMWNQRAEAEEAGE